MHREPSKRENSEVAGPDRAQGGQPLPSLAQGLTASHVYMDMVRKHRERLERLQQEGRIGSGDGPYQWANNYGVDTVLELGLLILISDGCSTPVEAHERPSTIHEDELHDAVPKSLSAAQQVNAAEFSAERQATIQGLDNLAGDVKILEATFPGYRVDCINALRALSPNLTVKPMARSLIS